MGFWAEKWGKFSYNDVFLTLTWQSQNQACPISRRLRRLRRFTQMGFLTTSSKSAFISEICETILQLYSAIQNAKTNPDPDSYRDYRDYRTKSQTPWHVKM
jgi:hypothetical protein